MCLQPCPACSDIPQPLEPMEQLLVYFIFSHGRSCVCWDCSDRRVHICRKGWQESQISFQGCPWKKSPGSFQLCWQSKGQTGTPPAVGSGAPGAKPQLWVSQLWDLSLALPQQRFHHPQAQHRAPLLPDPYPFNSPWLLSPVSITTGTPAPAA